MVEEFRTVQTDVLIVGAGGAGCRAAIEAGRSNVNTILIGKGFMGKSGTTVQASGRAVGGGGGRMTVEERFKYQLQSGCYLNDQDLLWIAVKETPEDVQELNKFAQEMNGGPTTSYNNALCYEISKYPNISVLENTIVTKLLTSSGRTVGATALDVRSGDVILFKAKAVILATGGYGDLYRPSECAPLGINGGVYGDGQALAYHAGAELVEMEMSQQQALPANPRWNLWYRHLFGFRSVVMDGPYFDKDGKVIPSLSAEAFASMPVGCGPPRRATYRPLTELTIYKESLKGPVYVNPLTPAKELIKQGKIKDVSEAPLSIADKALHVDPTKLPMIRIVIGALLGQGGPRINERCETNLPGLYAAGECPGNLYGSYRAPPFMDSILTHGKRAGKNAAEYVKTAKESPIDLEEVRKECKRVYSFLEPKPNAISPLEVKKKIWELTGKYLFMVRNAKGLREAIREVDELRKRDLPRVQAVDVRCFNVDLVEAVEAAFALDVAEMIARSALFREESRGCQYRDDFPEMDNRNWLCHTLLWKDLGTGEMKLSKAPVVMTRLKPPLRVGEEPIPV